MSTSVLRQPPLPVLRADPSRVAAAAGWEGQRPVSPRWGPTADDEGSRVRRLRRAGGSLAALTVCVSLGLTGLPAASGAPSPGAGPGPGAGNGAGSGDRAFPSKKQVDAARARAAHKADQVGVIKGRLAAANQRLQAASLAAEQASEAYNGAMWRLAEANRRYRAAVADAERARR